MSTAARVAACLLTIAPRARRLRAPLPVGVPAATPLAVKHEKDRPDSAERAEGSVHGAGARATSKTADWRASASRPGEVSRG